MHFFYFQIDYTNSIYHSMKNFLAYLAVIGSMLFWAISFIWSKSALEIYNPLTILSFRLILASVLLLGFSKIIGKLNKIEKGDWRYIFLLSFFEPFLYFIGETYGLQLVSPTIAAVIIATIPLFLPYVAWYFFKERVTKYKIYGTILSFIGVLMVIINVNMQLNANTLGVMLLMLAVFSAVGYTATLNKLSHKYNSFTIVSYQSLFGLIGFAPLFFIFDWSDFQQTGFVWQGLQPIILLAVFGSIIAFVLFTHSIKILGVTRSGVFTNGIPVLTSIFSFILLGERLFTLNYIGILIVVVGLFISQIKTKSV